MSLHPAVLEVIAAIILSLCHYLITHCRILSALYF